MPTDLETAAATVDSATTNEAVVTPAAPAFDAADQTTWSSAQRENWNRTGEQPLKSDSATDKSKAAPDSATENKDKKDQKKSADTASDSATDSTQKPHLKTKTDSENRFKELADENKTLKQRLEALERAKPSDTRDSKQVSQPAAEAKLPPLKTFLKDYFLKAENKGKEYEDGVEAWQTIRDADRTKQLEQNVRAQIAQEEAAKQLKTSIEEAKTRYPDYDQAKINHAVESIMDNTVPFPVKATLNASPVFVDLLYVLSEPKALADFVETAKRDPVAALRKIVLTEQLVQAELAKGKTSGGKGKEAAATDATRGEDGKFVSKEDKAAAEPKPRAPKPPSEVGGRGTAPEDAMGTAAEKGDFRTFEAAMDRRMKARQA